MSSRYVTFQDAYEHLLDFFDQQNKDVGVKSRRLQRSIQKAYRTLPGLARWSYFTGTGAINTTLPSTHTITYTASTGLATIETGTWNADAIYGAITISNTRYEIKRRVNDTTVELRDGPSANYTGSTRWQRFRYPLPFSVGDVVSITDPRQYFDIRRVDKSQTWWWQQVINAETFPLVWSLFPSREKPQFWEVWLSGSGDIERTLTYLYDKRMANLSVLETKNATSATVGISGDVATFSTSVLTDDMVGCVLRVSSTASHPTGYLSREERDPVKNRYTEVNNPPASEHLITAVNSGTEAILQHSASTVSSKGYSVSSHIDLNPGPMTDLFYRLCEEEWDIQSRAESPVRKQSSQDAQVALRRALIDDGRRHPDQSVSMYRGDVIQES